MTHAPGIVLAFATAVLVWASPAPVWAQATARTVRIGVDAEIFSHESLTLEQSSDSQAAGGFNIGKIDTVTTSYGLQQSMFGLDVGGGLGDSFVLGGRLVLGGKTSHADITTDFGDTEPETGTTRQTQLRVQLLPYLEYVFASGHAVRPFVAATAGYGYEKGSSIPLIVADGSDIQTSSSSKTSTALLGAAIGMHGFVAQTLSFDPELFFLYRVGTASIGDTTGLDASGFTIGVTLGISAWLGGAQ